MERATAIPSMNEILLINFKSLLFLDGFFLPLLFLKMSSRITVELEFKPEDRLDMAAANKAAVINPVNPGGSPTLMYNGNSESA